MLQLAEEVIRLTGSKSKNCLPATSWRRPSKTSPRFSQQKNIINWEPVVSLEEGILKRLLIFDRSISSGLS
jgi:UDP-glucuronate decarboxylase